MCEKLDWVWKPALACDPGPPSDKVEWKWGWGMGMATGTGEWYPVEDADRGGIGRMLL